MRVLINEIMKNCEKYHCDIDEDSCLIKTEDFDFFTKLIINNFKSVNWIFMSSIALAFILLFSKIFDIEMFEWNKISFPLKCSWLIISILTVIHYYFGMQLRKSINTVLETKCNKLKKRVYYDVISSENIFVRGLNKKPLIVSGIKKGFFLVVDRKDISYKLRFISNALLFASVLLTTSEISWWFSSIISITLVLANSLIASSYLVRLYRLAYYFSEESHSYVPI